MAKNLPEQFGPYTLHELIARGGMAEVYRATMPGIGGFEKPVAIKMILPHLAENEEFITMLIDEARIIVSVSHANIAQVYDLGRIEDNYYIAMEFIHGVDLAGLIKKIDERQDRMPIEHSVYIASCICAGLHVAHGKADEEGRPLNIVHRDVSPHNILLSYAGEVKIIDFGVAKARNKEAHTKAGVIKGKLLYMAPEQAMAKGVDGRADLFAAGLILYKMLTGIVPFDGENEFQIYNNLISKDVTPPRVLNPVVPPELDSIVMRMLEREPETRFQDGYTIKSELERVLHRVAPGYTNSRLSRYIEMIVNDEQDYDDGSMATVLDSGPHHFAPSETPAFNTPGTGQTAGGSDMAETVDASANMAEQERLRAQFRAQQQGKSSGFQQLGGVGAAPNAAFQPGGQSRNQVPSGQFQQQPPQFSSQPSAPADESRQNGVGGASGSGQHHRMPVNAPSSTMPPLPDSPLRTQAPSMATGKFGAQQPAPRKRSKVLPVSLILLLIVAIGGMLIYAVMQNQGDIGGETKSGETSGARSTTGGGARFDPSARVEPDPADEDVEPDEGEEAREEEVRNEAVALGEPIVMIIDTDPSGAEISIDGERLGTTPFKIAMDSSDEEMKIELELDDHKPHRMNLVPNSNIDQTIELEPTKKRPERRPEPDRDDSKSSGGSDDADEVEIPILGDAPPPKKDEKKPTKKDDSKKDAKGDSKGDSSGVDIIDLDF